MSSPNHASDDADLWDPEAAKEKSRKTIEAFNSLHARHETPLPAIIRANETTPFGTPALRLEEALDVIETTRRDASAENSGTRPRLVPTVVMAAVSLSKDASPASIDPPRYAPDTEPLFIERLSRDLSPATLTPVLLPALIQEQEPGPLRRLFRRFLAALRRLFRG